ncbi:MAG: hypothetical protein K2Q26_04745 [Bdellovibrionales bacterium]|nr:hypothetical protein [Bdellovibrionales bacterium]
MRFLLLLTLLSVSGIAQAQDWVVNPSLTYFSRKLEQTAGNNQIAGKLNVLTADVKGGYIFDYGLFVGVQAVYETGSGSGNDMTNYFVGPSVGYLSDDTGIFITATYHVVGTSDMDAAGKYGKAQGLQIDLGYPMMITEEIKFGPQLSYKAIKYTDGDAGLADNTTKQLTPYFGLWLFF